jgi:hypothetical protein
MDDLSDKKEKYLCKDLPEQPKIMLHLLPLIPSTSSSTLTANSPHSSPMASTSDTRDPIPGTCRELPLSENINHAELHLVSQERSSHMMQNSKKNSVEKQVSKVRQLAMGQLSPYHVWTKPYCNHHMPQNAQSKLANFYPVSDYDINLPLVAKNLMTLRVFIKENLV